MDMQYINSNVQQAIAVLKTESLVYKSNMRVPVPTLESIRARVRAVCDAEACLVLNFCFVIQRQGIMSYSSSTKHFR